MKTIDLFDTIEDQSVQLQPHGVVNMKRIEELTMQKITAQNTKTVKHRRSLGIYMLAAVLVTFLLATTVFAYVGFTQYENPVAMMQTFFGNKSLPSLESTEAFLPHPEGGGYTVTYPAIERIPLDEGLVQKVAPPIAAVGKTGIVNGNTVTVIAHQHDSILGAGTVYYTVENPDGINNYRTEFDGEILWDGQQPIVLAGTAEKHYMIHDQTTDTKLSVACYYISDKWGDWKGKQYIEMCFTQIGFKETSDPIQLPLDIFEPVGSLRSRENDILLTSIGLELHLEEMDFLQETFGDGTVSPPDTYSIKYLAVRFVDGTECVIEKDMSGESISNHVYAITYTDQEQNTKVGTYLFNRIIDLKTVESVIINDVEFKVS